MSSELLIRPHTQADYLYAWEAMKNFTDQRTSETSDEVWFIEHPPVYTLGQAGKREHILDAKNIPIIHVDRGGQITYHGPGQLMIYVLLDLKRLKISVRDLVHKLEQIIVATLADYKITAHAKLEAPGVYVEKAKICSIGLRIRKGCSYHGLAFNIDMDLTPFAGINPCGFANLPITQVRDYVTTPSFSAIIEKLVKYFQHYLGYTNAIILPE